jgi:outer membrane protein TolC
VGLFWSKDRAIDVVDLDARLRKAERDLSDLRLEWENAYEQLRRMMGRVSKRAAELDKREEKPADLPNPLSTDNGGFMSAAANAAQQAILRRRMR